MTTIDFFTEEESAGIILDAILPQLLPDGTEWNVYSFHGKNDMLQKLPNRLRAYRHRPLSSRKVVVLIDSDHQDRSELKFRLNRLRRRRGLLPKRPILNRFVLSPASLLKSWKHGFLEMSRRYLQHIHLFPKVLQRRRGMNSRIRFMIRRSNCLIF